MNGAERQTRGGNVGRSRQPRADAAVNPERDRPSTQSVPPAPQPADESVRLATVRSLGILDTPREAAFDDLVNLAARLLRAPNAELNIVDGDRLWVKAAVGTEQGRDVPREHSFCPYTILGDEPLVVPDARLDPRFSDNPFVPDALTYYWGLPLVMDNHQRIGSLCVFGDGRREPSHEELETLRVLAGAVSAHLQVRREAGALSRLAAVTSRLARVQHLEEVFVDVCAATRELVAADGAVVWRTESDGAMEAVASIGGGTTGTRLSRTEASACLSDRRLLTRRLSAETVAIKPITTATGPVGALCAWWRASRHDVVADRADALLELLAAEAAVAFERSSLLAASGHRLPLACL